MRPHQFQSDRSEALRRQLVEMPTLPGAEDPVRFGRARGTAELLERRTEAAASAEPQVEQMARSGRPLRVRRVLLATAAATIGVFVFGQTSLTIQSAHAAGVLRSAAEQSMTFVDPDPDPGQFLLVHKRANWLGSEFDEEGKTVTYMTMQRIDVYIPDDPNDEWVLDREWGAAGSLPAMEHLIHAPNGEFYDGLPWSVPWTQADLDNLPRDGQSLFELFDARYTGGSASRNEDNFVRITDLLKTGLVPADLRAGLYEALALIPGVNVTEQVNLDGEPGVAIGRTEPFRLGQRQEIIIDPDTGLVIGERTVMTWAAFGFGKNEVIGHTAMDYEIVDSAPAK